MKKALSMILVLALACSLFAGVALAAASDYVFTGGSVTVDGTTDKTIEVKFTTVQGGTFTAFQADWSKKEKESSSYLTLSALTSDIAEDALENDPSTGKTVWANLNINKTKDNLTVEENGAIWTATYIVDKNTPTGEYTVQLDVKSITDAGGNAIADAMGTWTATITVNNISAPPAEGYTVTVAADKTTAAVNDTVEITLDVTNSDSAITTFNAFYGTLTYNPTVFIYAGDDKIGTFSIDSSVSGELRIARADGNLAISDSDAELTIPFTAASTGTGTFGLSEFQVSQAAYANGNAPKAAVSGTPSVTVSQKYTVTYDGNGATGGTAPTQDPVTTGTQITLPAANAFTKEGYTFTGWLCDADNEVYDAGVSYTMTAANTTFTAQWSLNYTVTFVGGDGATGNAPKQDPVPAETKITLPANTFTKGDYTFAGWKCDVDNKTYNAGASYTMTAENTTFEAQWTETATATASIVSGYLDGYTLIKVTVTGDTDQTPTYDNNTMFKLSGSAYDANAYYYIVKGTIEASTAQGKLGWSDSAATTLTKDGDANQTGRIDINDAQFIYNLYGSSVSYEYVPTAAQLLASDVNGDGSVDTLDCAAAIAAIK